MGVWLSTGGVTPSWLPEKIIAGTVTFEDAEIAEGVVSAGANPIIVSTDVFPAPAKIVAPPPLNGP